MKALSINGKFDLTTRKRTQKWLKVKEDGIFKTQSVKALQKKVKAKIDGKWGTQTTKALQRHLNKYGATLEVDGKFGVLTRKALQRHLNRVFKKQIDPAPSPAPTPTPAPTDKAAAIVAIAKKCAWPYGTAESKYKYPSGSPTAGFKDAIRKAYPDRSKWGKQTRAGASCDVFVGTVIRASGYDTKFPRGLDEVVKHCRNNPKWQLTGIKKLSDLKPGDILYQEWKGGGHIVVYLGGGKCANAHYVGKTYGVIEEISKVTKSASKCQIFNVYRAK